MVNYIRQILKHNDYCTSLDCMEDTPLYLALQDSYNIDSANVINLPSTANKKQNTHQVNFLCLQHCQHGPFLWLISQQVHHLTETDIRRVCRILKSTSFRAASVDCWMSEFGQQFHSQIEDNLVHEVSELVLRYDQIVLIDNKPKNVENSVLYRHQQYYWPISVEDLGPDCCHGAAST